MDTRESMLQPVRTVPARLVVAGDVIVSAELFGPYRVSARMFGGETLTFVLARLDGSRRVRTVEVSGDAEVTLLGIRRSST